MVKLVCQLATRRPKVFSSPQSIKSAYIMISCDGELLVNLAVGLYLEIIIFVVQMLKLYDKVTGF